MTRTNLLTQIQTIAAEAFDLENALPAFDLELTPDPKFGDFATNAAMVLAKSTKTAPRAVAEVLQSKLKQLDGVAKVEIAGPGFINLTMTDAYWSKSFGAKHTAPENKGKLQLEFISANPTGPLTLANARGGFLGDVLANVLSADGWEVVREHYLNDAGGQIGKLVESIKNEAGLPTTGELQYQGPYIKEVATQIKPTADMSDEEIGVAAVEVIVGMIQSAVERMGVHFDVWFSEQTLLDDGVVEAVLAQLDAKGLIYEADGARWLASSKYGDARDRVVIKSNGESIYLLNDLAYHYNIFVTRKFDRAIKIWGADHGGQVASLKLTVGELVPDARLEFILLQLVHIIKDGKEFKSSKRAGTYITMDELIDEIGDVAVARWFFLSRSADTQMDFDINLAAETSLKNPYYYVMYSYARACSILAKAGERNISASHAPAKLTDAELALAKQMSRLPEMISDIATDFGVHRLTFYSQDLAKLFTTYYDSMRIIDLPVPEASQRLYVVQRYIDTMEHIFGLLGIEPVQRMISDDSKN